jgi:F-type H+-transporting ATPase subunit delta
MLRGRASDLLVDALQVVNKKDRLAILPQIVSCYHEEHRELIGQLEVRISTAVELTDAQREYVRERTRVTQGKDTYLVETVDPDLLGGLVIQLGDRKIDMTVRRDLELLSQRFAARLSEEMLAGKGFAVEIDVTGGDDAGDEARPSHDGRNEE